MGRGSFTIGSIAGVRIGLHPSWLVIAFLITYSLAVGDLPDRFRGWEPILYWVVAAGVALLFFASVLAHELSHALVARRYGIEVKDITLFIFGGAASLEGDARTPGQEALIAFAGPLSSLVIGAVLIGIGLVWPQEQVLALIGWLAVINLSLGVFNLLPGFPMDGGRILRALIWKVRGDPEVATRNAAAVGRLVGYLLIGVGEPAREYGPDELVATPEEAAELLAAQLEPGDTVLVKGSRSAGLEAVAETLRELVDG